MMSVWVWSSDACRPREIPYRTRFVSELVHAVIVHGIRYNGWSRACVAIIIRRQP